MSRMRGAPNLQVLARTMEAVAMIPTPRGPGDLPVPPEEPRPAVRREGASSLVFQALEEIEAVKRTLADLMKRLEAVEHRISALETPKA